MRRYVIGVILALGLLLATVAAHAASLGERDHLRARVAWDELRHARAEVAALDEAQASPAAASHGRRRFSKALRALLQAMPTSRWIAFEPEGDEALMHQEVLATLASTLVTSEPALAIQAAERHELLYADTEMAPYIRSWMLPLALLRGNPESARARLTQLLGNALARERPLVQLALVDALALEGRLADARDLAAEILAAARQVEDVFPSKYLIHDSADVRSRVLGRPLGEIVPTMTVGGASRGKRGVDHSRITLVSFWEPWCGACLSDMKGLSRLDRRFRRHGVRVIGVTRGQFSSQRPKEAPSVGEVGPMLADFVARQPIDYPILLVGDAFFAERGVVGLPVDLVVDEQGTVVLALTVSQQEALLEHAIETLLARRRAGGSADEPRRRRWRGEVERGG